MYAFLFDTTKILQEIVKNNHFIYLNFENRVNIKYEKRGGEENVKQRRSYGIAKRVQ